MDSTIFYHGQTHQHEHQLQYKHLTSLQWRYTSRNWKNHHKKQETKELPHNDENLDHRFWKVIRQNGTRRQKNWHERN